MPIRRITPLRWATVTLAAISWLAISNHCALGLATIGSHQAEAVSGHGCCASTIPADSEPAKRPAAPCCKTLHVVAMTPAENFPSDALAFAGLAADVVTGAVISAPPASLASRFLDTGPPPGPTFAESVLQRSLRAHAPPVFS
jgi:hypothetical protein